MSRRQRENILAIRLTEMERAAGERLAAKEMIPLSTLVRRDMLKRAERDGIWPPLHTEPPKAKE